jgi:hypothetical protein
MPKSRDHTYASIARRAAQHRRTVLYACAAALLLGMPLGAQQAATSQATSGATLFVSRLNAEPVEYQVKVSWIDPPDAKGTCLVYRAAAEITTQSIAAARLVGKAPTGTQYFVDTPPDRAGYFYAVLFQDSAGTLYPLVIPFRNKTSSPVAAATSAPEEQLAATITSIVSAPTSVGDGIVVSFSTTNPGRELLLFWSTAPLTVPEDLLKSTSTAALDAGVTRYVLAALPGVDYWFAVLDSGLYKLGQAPLIKGSNTTAQPVQIPVGSGVISLGSPGRGRRAFPLPSLSLNYGVQSGTLLPLSEVPDLPTARKVSPDTEKAIAQLLQAIPPSPPMRPAPQVLRSDMTPSPSGQIARLQEVVQGPFLGGDMVAAQKKLGDFLSLPRAADIEARARFYLGQAYFIQGRERDALLEFLAAEDFFYEESQAWIAACFDKLEKIDQ